MVLSRLESVFLSPLLHLQFKESKFTLFALSMAGEPLCKYEYAGGMKTKSMPLIWQPIQHDAHWLDIFQYPISAQDGLPPTAQLEVIREIAKRLEKVRPRAAIWVSISSPGHWYLNELRRLRYTYPPIAIMPAGKMPVLNDFSSIPFHQEALFPPDFPLTRFDTKEFTRKAHTELTVLRVAARLGKASAKEIAAQSGISRAYASRMLVGLQQNVLVERALVGKYAGWEITRQGIMVAHRSWNIPAGISFATFRREQRYAGYRHRRVARLWPAWLKASFRVQIWSAWSEPSLRPGFPDALAWGLWLGQETLFWLEVDAGKKNQHELRRLYTRRWKQAAVYARQHNLPIIFVVLAKPWVLSVIRPALRDLPDGMAVLLQDWRDFGHLPMPNFGYCTYGVVKGA
jgi:hypothetical protein